MPERSGARPFSARHVGRRRDFVDEPYEQKEIDPLEQASARERLIRIAPMALAATIALPSAAALEAKEQLDLPPPPPHIYQMREAPVVQPPSAPGIKINIPDRNVLPTAIPLSEQKSQEIREADTARDVEATQELIEFTAVEGHNELPERMEKGVLLQEEVQKDLLTPAAYAAAPADDLGSVGANKDWSKEDPGAQAEFNATLDENLTAAKLDQGREGIKGPENPTASEVSREDERIGGPGD